VIRRALELGWPTALVVVACCGLALSNWLRPPQALPMLGAGIAVLASLLVQSDAARLAAFAVVLACVGLWWGSLRLDALGESTLLVRIGEHSDARVVVTGPVRRTPYEIRIPAEVRRFAGSALRERVLLELPPGRAPPQGSILELRAELVAPRGPETGFDERGWLDRRGVHVVVRAHQWRIIGRRGGLGGVADRLHAHVATALARGGGGGERGAVLAGVVLGDDDRIDAELRDDFRASGLYHLLAVSGQNVAFVVGGTLVACWLLGLGRVIGEVAAITAVSAYVLAVGWQPSVVRAGVAGILASLAWLASRPRDRWHFLALGALVLLVWTPASLLEPGFQLSFAAVAAILLSVGRLRRFHAGAPLPWRLVELAGIAAACGAATAPILWLQFGSVPLWTVPANALAEPAMPLLLGLGLLAAVVDPLSPSAAAALAWLAGWCAAWLSFCARLIARMPYAETSSPVPLAILVCVGMAILVLRKLSPRKRTGFVVTAAVTAAVLLVVAWSRGGPHPTAPPTGLRVTFLDVGQGDATLLEVPQGAILVDQGPPEAEVATQLRGMGLDRLSALVLTHPQRDHVGGAEAVLTDLRVGELLEPGLAVDTPEDDAALRAARGRDVPITVARAGQAFRLGRLIVRVLWPDGPGSPADDPNDNAVVLLASYGETDLLLAADAESNVTRNLIGRAIDILKVAHHGSEDAGLPAQLLVLRPVVAVVSVGAHNDYGHPTQETLAALEAVPGLALYRTDLDGEITVESNGREIFVRTAHGVRSDE
jgi:competence protein ComEC